MAERRVHVVVELVDTDYGDAVVGPGFEVMGVYDTLRDAEAKVKGLDAWNGRQHTLVETMLHTPEEVHEWRPFVTYNIAKKMCIHCGDVRRVMELPR